MAGMVTAIVNLSIGVEAHRIREYLIL